MPSVEIYRAGPDYTSRRQGKTSLLWTTLRPSGKWTKQVLQSDGERSLSTLLTVTRMIWRFSLRLLACSKRQERDRGVQGDPRNQDAPKGKAIGTRSANNYNSRQTEPWSCSSNLQSAEAVHRSGSHGRGRVSLGVTDEHRWPVSEMNGSLPYFKIGTRARRWTSDHRRTCLQIMNPWRSTIREFSYCYSALCGDDLVQS